MTKQEFMSRLGKRLKRLPSEEYNDAVQYYEQYFEDADDIDAAMRSLGSPEQVATKIFADFAEDFAADFAGESAGGRAEKKSAWKTVWIVILAIFAAPIALPVAVAVGAVAIALVISACAVILALAVAGVAVVAAGIFGAILSLAFIVSHFPTTLFFVGFGIFSTGFGVLFFAFAVWLAKKTGAGFLALFSKILRRTAKVEPECVRPGSQDEHGEKEACSE